MNKPEFLYHGSPYCFEVVKPMQASGSCEKESRFAIYAAETFDVVIPFALPTRWYPDDPSGKRDFICDGGRLHITYGSLNPEAVCYVYKLKSDTFEKVDEWQWVSNKECIPVERVEIKVKDYMDKVTFSEEAMEIQRKLGYV